MKAKVSKQKVWAILIKEEKQSLKLFWKPDFFGMRSVSLEEHVAQ